MQSNSEGFFILIHHFIQHLSSSLKSYLAANVGPSEAYTFRLIQISDQYN